MAERAPEKREVTGSTPVPTTGTSGLEGFALARWYKGWRVWLGPLGAGDLVFVGGGGYCLGYCGHY